MPETICPFCKKNWPQDFRWCMEDGSELEDDKGQYVEDQSGMPGIECPECGAKVDPRDEFCAGCGTRLQTAEAARALSNELSCSKCGALVNPNDDFCGGCGAGINTIAGQAADEPQSLPAQAAGACPNCGMEITPGEAFCGTCGHSAQAAAPAQPQPQTGYTSAAAPASCPGCGAGVTPGEMFCGSCGFNMSSSAAPSIPQQQHAPAPQSGAGCPNCGMEVTPGETFCGTCGHNLQGAAAPAQQYQAPAAAGLACPSCGMEVAPGDPFCGTCGHNMQGAAPAAQEPQSYQPATPQADSGCPNCGMEVAPGETFCGTCGHNLQGAPAHEPPAAAQHYEAPAEPGAPCPNCGVEVAPGEMFCGSCGFNTDQTAAPAPAAQAYQPTEPSAPAPSGAGCPSCGMEVDPGETFCGTCGFNMQAAPAPAQAPIHPSSEASVPSLSCPNCGMEISPGEPFCGTCGHNLNETSSTVDHAQPAAPAAPQPAPALEIGGSCPSCGMEFSPGDPFCGTCGFNLSNTPEPAAPQTSAAPAAQPGAGCPNCGMENDPGETYCATCGFEIQGGGNMSAFSHSKAASQPSAFDSAPSQAYQPFADGPVPNTAVAPAHGAQCPVCGANVYDGEDSCGSCGNAMGGQSAYDLSQPVRPQADKSSGPYDGFIPLKKKSYFTCAKCGSSNTAPGGMYCADCGAMVGEGLEDEEFNADNEEQAEPVEQPPLRSLSDYMEYEKVCPECNIVAAPGSDTCLVCGMKIGSGEDDSFAPAMEIDEPRPPAPYISDEDMIPHPPSPVRPKPSAPLADFTSDEPVWSAPVSDQFSAASASDFQPVGDDFVATAQEPAWDEAPAWGAAPPPSSGAPICVECGATASSGDALCPSCGGLLIMPEAPVSHQPFSMPEPAAPAPEIPKPAEMAFPPMPEDKPAAPDITGGKVCACCGVSNLQEAEYCASCGVDFD